MSWLGLDLGTSSLKALVIDEDEGVVAEATAPLTVSRPHSGWSEQDPDAWIAACETVFEKLGDHLSDVRGIGLSGHQHGVVMLDGSDTVLRPCLLWNDTRAHEEAAEMDTSGPWREITGNMVLPGFSAPKVEWVRRNEPQVFDATDCVLLPKDYLRLWLTGERVAEMSDASGTSWLDVAKRDWSDDLLSRAGLSRDHMGRLVEGSDAAAQLRPELSRRFKLPEGIAVAGGAGDNAASAIGVGATGPGVGFVSLGTSGVLFVSTDALRPGPDDVVHSFCHAVPDTWHQMGVMLQATDALNWWSGIAGAKPAQLTDALGDLRAPGRPVFLPYLGGERTPIDAPLARGALLGLEHATDREAITRAVLEGVAFGLRDCRDAIAATGTTVDSLLAVGGGTRSDYWLSLIATVLDTPLDLPEAGDFGGAFGAARLGRMAATGDLACDRPPIRRTIEPVADLRDAMDAGHNRYAKARHFVKDFT